MSQDPSQQSGAPEDRLGTGRYVHGYGEKWKKWHGSRTAAHDAGFLIPHLRPGMSLLDCGCGPGSITCDLAEIVAPGQVVGLDISDSQLGSARALAAERGLSGVRFEMASIFEIPYPDASFDAAFAHNVLTHLGDPLRAMREMRRVLKPGGVIGIGDSDWGAMLFEPSTSPGRRYFDLFIKVSQHNGASPFYARHLRRLLREAGFVNVDGSAKVESVGTLERTRAVSQAWVAQLRDPAFVATVLEQGWADQATLEVIAADLEAWGERPDVFGALMVPTAVGWVP